MGNNNVNEEVLFNFTTNADTGVNEEVLFKNTNEEELDYIEPVFNGNMGNEVLFKNNNIHEESLDYNFDGDIGGEVLFKNTNDIYEESLNHEIHGNYESNGVGGEVLFNAGGEDLIFTQDGQYEIQGEDLVFAEPVMPNYMDEEVLFKNEEVIEVVDETAVEEYESAGDIFAESLLESLEDEVIVAEKKVYEDKNFAQKMLEADPIILERYNELKNVMLAYKGVKSRISNNFDSFNMGRTQLIKMCTSGKSLKLYLNLNFDEVETRLKCKYAGDKKAYAQVPVFLRIKSPRAMRNAKYLIEQVVSRFELKPNKKFTGVDGIQILKDHYAKTEN